ALGATHRRRGQPCQDAVEAYDAATCLVLAVADGHGSARSFKSDVGSRLAVGSALRQLVHFQREAADQSLSAIRDFAVAKLPRLLVQDWREAVAAREPERADPPSWLIEYGSTLLALLATPRYLLYVQIGDGDILAVAADGAVSRPIPPNPLLFGNDTTSLCQPNAWEHVAVALEPLASPASAPALALLATDGYANSFASAASFEQVGGDLLALARQPGGWATVERELPGWIEETTALGSGDDISVAVLWNAAAAQEEPA
ncbi:MAG TPA: PP2C family serine/threonine-protein phosphatase, partial [Herpetosiphonaceae bacterium]